MPIICVAFRVPVRRIAPIFNSAFASCWLHKFNVAPVSHRARTAKVPTLEWTAATIVSPWELQVLPSSMYLGCIGSEEKNWSVARLES